jgi:hypothetical protein
LETIVVILNIMLEELGYFVGVKHHVVEAVDVGHAIHKPLESHDGAERFVFGRGEISEL